MPGNSKIMHCGIFFNLPYRFETGDIGSTNFFVQINWHKHIHHEWGWGFLHKVWSDSLFFTYHNLQYLYSICGVTTNSYGNKLSYVYHIYIIMFYVTNISLIIQLRLPYYCYSSLLCLGVGFWHEQQELIWVYLKYCLKCEYHQQSNRPCGIHHPGLNLVNCVLN